jgi:hypothetical protein
LNPNRAAYSLNSARARGPCTRTLSPRGVTDCPAASSAAIALDSPFDVFVTTKTSPEPVTLPRSGTTESTGVSCAVNGAVISIACTPIV